MTDPVVLLPVALVVVVVVLLVWLFRMSWRVAEPDEALIISGLRAARAPEGVGAPKRELASGEKVNTATGQIA